MRDGQQVRVDDDHWLTYTPEYALASEPPIAPDLQYVGLGGASRTVSPNFNLGLGVFRPRKRYGLRRAIWDAAFGYVSGFRKRDIAYYVLTRSLSFRIWVVAFRAENARRRQEGEAPMGRKVKVSIAADVKRYLDALRAHPSPETYEQRRDRICSRSGIKPSMYDRAYRFGYEPESWDGMWKLRARRPIIQITRNWAMAAEVVEKPGTHTGERTWRGKQKIRYVLRRARDAQ